MTHPILYSFRRCPYAIRARLAMQFAADYGYAEQVKSELREVVLKNKPSVLLTISAKATVPVLQLSTEVLDESLDIMRWALSNIPWIDLDQLDHPLVAENDGSFKSALDLYKYFDRFPERTQEEYWQDCLIFLKRLEGHFENGFLVSSELSPIDLAVFPFVRQCAFVDKPRFDSLELPKLQAWLEQLLKHDLFLRVMPKYVAWQTGNQIEWFPSN